MILLSKIIMGCSFDLFAGDPYSLTHPVQLIGKLIRFLERLLSRAGNKKAAGILLMLSVVGVSYMTALGLSAVSFVFELFLIYSVFAIHSLAKEAKAVYLLLHVNNLEEARKRLSYLVSRDTSQLDTEGILRATIETVAENIVDGIISPMFYLFLGGAPLAIAFKAASTLDSMVGYKNEKYAQLGWASARFDDFCNFVPARFTAFVCIPLAARFQGHGYRRTLSIVLRDRKKHASPNAGHAEAAVAGALGVRLGGPNYYFGKKVEKPYLGDNSQALQPHYILETIHLMVTTSLCALFIMSVLYCVVFLLVR